MSTCLDADVTEGNVRESLTKGCSIKCQIKKSEQLGSDCVILPFVDMNNKRNPVHVCRPEDI